MTPRTGILIGALAALTGLVACDGPENPILMNATSNTRSPDEFAILPTKPLVMPTDLAALPAPTPGGTNLTDPTPQADAVAALGGRPELLGNVAIPAADGAIVSAASRFGVAAGIRDRLAAEDLQFRRANNPRLLERLFNVNTYHSTYRDAGLTIDKHAELRRWRAAGARTPSAPPDPSLD